MLTAIQYTPSFENTMKTSPALKDKHFGSFELSKSEMALSFISSDCFAFLRTDLVFFLKDSNLAFPTRVTETEEEIDLEFYENNKTSLYSKLNKKE